MTRKGQQFDSVTGYQRSLINKKDKHPVFDISTAYEKLYYANGEKEVTLTAHEADELLDYIQYMTWLTNPPKK